MNTIAEVNKTNHVKYPRTFHLPYSPGTTSDDKKLVNDLDFVNSEVLMTEKLDGENTNMTFDRIWARSVDSKDHPSRNWVNSFWNQLKYDIPNDMRICGENVYAKHSIHYKKLPTYFFVFSIWRYDECLSWEDTLEWCELLGLTTVPVLYRGIYSKDMVTTLASMNSVFGGDREGIVVRKPNSFTRDSFSTNLTKWVRKGHVQTDKHWMSQAVVPNELE